MKKLLILVFILVLVLLALFLTRERAEAPTVSKETVPEVVSKKVIPPTSESISTESQTDTGELQGFEAPPEAVKKLQAER